MSSLSPSPSLAFLSPNTFHLASTFLHPSRRPFIPLSRSLIIPPGPLSQENNIEDEADLRQVINCFIQCYATPVFGEYIADVPPPSACASVVTFGYTHRRTFMSRTIFVQPTCVIVQIYYDRSVSAADSLSTLL
ncbi:hypothetical protein C8R44DRAFT_865688 [Mycena epipterygia]|nr:hypothetical protein C8R44DRAFT_865688 [Mycena epipterygia]